MEKVQERVETQHLKEHQTGTMEELEEKESYAPEEKPKQEEEALSFPPGTNVDIRKNLSSEAGGSLPPERSRITGDSCLIWEGNFFSPSHGVVE